MNNFEYVDHSDTTRRAWTRAREIHRLKLVEIERNPSRKAHTPLPKFLTESRTRKRSKGKKKIAKERIRKENSLMFKKIFDAAPLINTNIRSGTSTPRLNNSLYGGFESREKEKIKTENLRLAKKIIQAGPSFTIKKFKEDYRNIEKIKKNICKPHSMTSKFSHFPVLRGQSLHVKKRSVI